MSRELLIIMARYPTLGRVKTRLARDIGKAAALRVYRQLLEHHFREFADPPFDVEWRYTPARAPFRALVAAVYDRRPSALIERRYRCLPQPDGDLGERMQRIFEQGFGHGHRHVVMIGTDAPEMNRATVRGAFRLLKTHPAVFLPTRDGGYALVGLCSRESHSRREGDGRESVSRLQVFQAIFSGISWSTHKVMAQTRRRLRARRISFAELPATFDVDTATDLRRFGSSSVTRWLAGR